MKPVVIIGGGFSGIICLKTCLENGIEAVIYERLKHFGGLWRFREDVDEDGIPSVTQNTIIDTSKEVGSLSDFPPPTTYPNYMHNSKMIEYLTSYVRAHNLESKINLNHEIISIEKGGEYQKNGEWTVAFIFFYRTMAKRRKLKLGLCSCAPVIMRSLIIPPF